MAGGFPLGEVISGGAGIIGSLIGGAFQKSAQRAANRTNLAIARETNAQNYQIFREQNEFNKEQFNNYLQYNTPAAQRARYEDAGINPYMALGNMQNGNAQSALTSANSAPMQATQVQPENGMANGIQSALLNAATIMSAVSDARLKSAAADKQNLENGKFAENFAMQMAEKYHLPKITLSEDAKKILLHYKWPGNVRQLKNITEQMSVLSEQREITAEMLTNFIPRDSDTTQLAIIGKDGEHNYESERDILYQILYELRGNVSDLRRDLNNVRKQLEETRALNGAQGFEPLPEEHHNTMPIPRKHTLSETSPSNGLVEFADAEEISEPEILNLSDVGRQMVEKALERNNGNRKKAAQELGISDRTLYRRIKQYGLDSK